MPCFNIDHILVDFYNYDIIRHSLSHSSLMGHIVSNLKHFKISSFIPLSLAFSATEDIYKH